MPNKNREADLITWDRPAPLSNGINWLTTVDLPVVLNIPYAEAVQATVSIDVEDGHVVVKVWRPWSGGIVGHVADHKITLPNLDETPGEVSKPPAP